MLHRPHQNFRRPRHVEPLLMLRPDKPPVSIETFWSIMKDENGDVPISDKMNAWEAFHPEPEDVPHLALFTRNKFEILRQEIDTHLGLSNYQTLDAARAVLGEFPGQDVPVDRTKQMVPA